MAAETVTGGREATSAVVPGRYALSIGNPELPLPNEWAWTPLTSVARLESGHTPSRRSAEYWDGGVPWIGIKDATGNHGRVIADTLQHTSQLGIENSSARMLPTHTVCLSRTASVGYVVVMGQPMATSQDFVNWVCSERLDWRFLRHVLCAETDALRRFAYGTTHQTIYFPDAKAFHIALPPISEQRAIASVLGALDDKIESNRRIIADLRLLDREMIEAQLQSVSWSRVLGEVAEVVDCLHSKKPTQQQEGRQLLQLKNIGDDGLFDPSLSFLVSPEDFARWTQRIRLREGDCIITNVGRVGAVARIPRIDAGLGRNMTAIRPRAHPFLLASTLASPGMRREIELLTDAGTIMDALNVKNIPRLRFPHLDDTTSKALDEECSKRWLLAEGLVREALTLGRTRDALLPKLVSGQIRVPLSDDPAESLGAAVEQHQQEALA